MQPVRIFFSYCHRDEDLRDEMVKHLSILKRQKVIEAWYDRDIDAGSKWEEEIYEQLSKAHIVLLLISPDFLNSEYCYENELKQAMERHEAGKALVIPIVLRSCDWRGAPFGKFQALPKDAKPVTSWPDRDAAFTNIAQGIRKAVSKIIPLNFANDSQDQKVSLTDGLISKSSNPDFLTSQRKTITESPDIFVNLRKAYAELTNAQNELERRALEIVESNDLLQQILSTMSDALFLTDHVGCVVRANRASSALLKCDESSILGQQLSEILSTKKIPSTPAKLMEFVRTKRGNNLEKYCKIIKGKRKDF
jgi:PAS domain-containing protein